MWQCIQCQSDYDVADIESALIEAAQRTSMGYVLQDLNCTKCNQVSRFKSRLEKNANFP